MAMKYFNIGIEILIVLSLMSFAIETVPDLDTSDRNLLHIFEAITSIIFLVEYIIRFSIGKIKYALSFLGVIDLISVVPVVLFLAPQFSILKSLRLLRLVRMIKFFRYFKSLQKIGQAIIKVEKELASYMMVNFFMLYILAVVMYYVERNAQPDKFASILDSLWWAVITLTTIGYGDISPVTPIGKLITSIISMLGLGIITIPTGLIASTLIKTKNDKLVESCGCSKEEDD